MSDLQSDISVSSMRLSVTDSAPDDVSHSVVTYFETVDDEYIHIIIEERKAGGRTYQTKSRITKETFRHINRMLT